MLYQITMIANAIGNDKIEEIKKHSEIKKAIQYAYDPHKKFYITAPDIDGVVNGSDDMSEAFGIMDRLASRELSGQAALEEVCDMIVSLTPNSAECFKRILNKDLRAGINVSTINKAWPGFISLVWDGSVKPPFALCKTFNPKKAKYPLMVAIKKDGVRGQKIDKMISRQGKALIGHNHIESSLELFNHDMDGEICIPGLIFDIASGKIRDGNPTPGSVFWIFDSPSIPGTKLERYKRLENIIPLSMTETNIALIKHHIVNTEKELMIFYDWAINIAKEEGIVIYDPDGEYQDGRIWERLVPIQSEDCKVIGFFEGKGKHAGSLGGVIISYNGHVVRVGTGFAEKVSKAQLKQLVTYIDNKLLTLNNKKVEGYSIEKISPIWQNIRQFIWDNRYSFDKVVAKIEFKEKTKAGSMRQPRFKGWRWDKC